MWHYFTKDLCSEYMKTFSKSVVYIQYHLEERYQIADVPIKDYVLISNQRSAHWNRYLSCDQQLSSHRHVHNRSANVSLHYHENVYCSIIWNSPKLEAAQKPIHNEIIVYSFNEINTGRIMMEKTMETYNTNKISFIILSTEEIQCKEYITHMISFIRSKTKL